MGKVRFRLTAEDTVPPVGRFFLPPAGDFLSRKRKSPKSAPGARRGLACAPKDGAGPKGSAPGPPEKFARGVSSRASIAFRHPKHDGAPLPSAGYALVPSGFRLSGAPIWAPGGGKSGLLCSIEGRLSKNRKSCQDLNPLDAFDFRPCAQAGAPWGCTV